MNYNNLLISISILNLLDLFTTLYAISLVGNDVEANPIGFWILQQYGVWLFIITKILAMVYFVFAFYRLKNLKFKFWGLTCVNSLYITIVVNNIINIVLILSM